MIRKYLFILMLFCFNTFAYASPAEDIEKAVLQERWKDALNLIDQQALANPGMLPDTLEYYRGLSQLNLGVYDQAIWSFSDVAASSSHQGLADQARLGLIDCYFLQNNYKEALRQGRDFLSASKHSSYMGLLYLKLAKVHLKEAQWQQARRYLNKVVREFPHSMEVDVARRLLQEKRYFAVQIGAFTEQPLAEALVEELKAKGNYAYIIADEDRKNGPVYFRVRVGQLASLSEAQTLEQSLAQLGYPTRIYP